MAYKRISQREARRIQKALTAVNKVLENQRNQWCSDFPGGVHIATEPNVTAPTAAAIKTARALKMVIVVVPDSGGWRVYAV